MTNRKSLASRSLLENKYLYLMLLPGLIYFLVYRYVPMFGLAIAFKKYYPARGFWDSQWVGLHYFLKIFRSPEIIRVIGNTLLISTYKILFAFPVPILLALMINEIRNMPFKKTVQTISYLPHFLSWVVFGEIIKVFLGADGAVNALLGLFGQGPVYFLIDAGLFRGITVVTAILKNSGWGTIVYLASISTIDPQLYEAAYMDGANRLRRIGHITLPSIKGVITVMLILRVGHILDAGFEQIFVLYNEAVYSTGDIFGTYVYRVGLSQGEYSLATAVGLFKGLVGLFMIWGANRISKTLGEEGVW